MWVYRVGGVQIVDLRTAATNSRLIVFSRTSSAYRSRTPTPNRFTRFDPTSYNEERKRKIQASQERM